MSESPPLPAYLGSGTPLHTWPPNRTEAAAAPTREPNGRNCPRCRRPGPHSPDFSSASTLYRSVNAVAAAAAAGALRAARCAKGSPNLDLPRSMSSCSVSCSCRAKGWLACSAWGEKGLPHHAPQRLPCPPFAPTPSHTPLQPCAWPSPRPPFTPPSHAPPPTCAWPSLRPPSSGPGRRATPGIGRPPVQAYEK